MLRSRIFMRFRLNSIKNFLFQGGPLATAADSAAVAAAAAPDLLLLQNLALLHLLHHLLRRADGAIRAPGSGPGRGAFCTLRVLDGGLLLRRLRRVFVAFLLRTIHGAIRRTAGAWEARTEDDLTRGVLADISGEKHVVTGALQKLRKHIARLAGTVRSIDALIGTQTFYLRSRLSRDLAENLLEAGVGGIDAQAVGIPDDGGGVGFVVDRPVGHGRRGWCLGYRCGLRLF